MPKKARKGDLRVIPKLMKPFMLMILLTIATQFFGLIKKYIYRKNFRGGCGSRRL